MRLLTGFTIALVLARPAVCLASDDHSGSTDGPVSIEASVEYGVPGGDGSPTGSIIPCRWVKAGDAASIEGPQVTEKTVAGVVYHLYLKVCGTSLTEHWIADVDTHSLAVSAESLVRDLLDDPAPHMSPPAGAGVVNVGVWLWTDAQQFVPHSVTAWVPTASGNVWSTTTATPVNLLFASGEPGAAPVVCAGPGTPWTDGETDDAVSDCMCTYRHSSSIAPAGSFATTMSIVWRVNWAASDGTSGELPDLVTSTSGQATIDEIQALVND